MFEGCCCRVVGSSCLVAALEPTVPGLTAGPLLPPALPGMPAPEFWALGADEASDLADWAKDWVMPAGTASTSATAATLANHFIVSSRCQESRTDQQSAAVVVPRLPHRRSFAISP